MLEDRRTWPRKPWLMKDSLFSALYTLPNIIQSCSLQKDLATFILFSYYDLCKLYGQVNKMSGQVRIQSGDTLIVYMKDLF